MFRRALEVGDEGLGKEAGLAAVEAGEGGEGWEVGVELAEPEADGGGVATGLGVAAGLPGQETDAGPAAGNRAEGRTDTMIRSG